MVDYIKVVDYQLMVVFNQGVKFLDQPFTKYMNQLLKPTLVNLRTREKLTRRCFGFNHKVPIIVDHTLLLMCIKSYRLQEGFYINYYQILYWEKIDNQVIIYFKNDHCIKVNSYQIFMNQIKKVNQILSQKNISI